MYIIGIDPGIKGAFVVFDGKIPRWTGGLSTFIEHVRWLKIQGFPAHAYVEELGPVSFQGVKSLWTQARGIGWIVGVLEALEVPYTIVRPNEWQETFLIGGSRSERKAASKAAAQALWPEMFTAKSSDGLTDAALIGKYGVSNHGQDDLSSLEGR